MLERIFITVADPSYWIFIICRLNPFRNCYILATFHNTKQLSQVLLSNPFSGPFLVVALLILQ